MPAARERGKQDFQYARVLLAFGHTVNVVAKRTGISQKTLYRRLESEWRDDPSPKWTLDDSVEDLHALINRLILEFMLYYPEWEVQRRLSEANVLYRLALTAQVLIDQGRTLNIFQRLEGTKMFLTWVQNHADASLSLVEQKAQEYIGETLKDIAKK